MEENEAESKNLEYSKENIDTEGNIIITKRKIINANIEIEYYIPKKTKNNNTENKSKSKIEV